MNQITLRVIDGPDMGSVFSNLSFPVSIGRESENTIELKDERASRFHLKIVRESDLPLLVDLGSTNGTQVNGEVVQFWFLRPGDLITVGRTCFLFGSRLEISERLKEVRQRLNQGDSSYPLPKSDSSSAGFNDELQWEKTFYAAMRNELFSENDSELLRTTFPPEMPSRLTPAQIAQMTSMFSYFMLRFRNMLENVRSFDVGIDSSFKGQDSLNENNLKNAAKKKSFFKKVFTPHATNKNNTDSISFLKEIIPDGGILLPLREYENLLDMISLFSGYLASLTRDIPAMPVKTSENSEDFSEQNENQSENS